MNSQVEIIIHTYIDNIKVASKESEIKTHKINIKEYKNMQQLDIIYDDQDEDYAEEDDDNYE